MKWDKIASTILGLFGGVANYLWGGWDMALKTLILFMLLDYILGMLCGYRNKKLSSETAFKGIFKKIAILIVISVSVSMDNITNSQGLIRGLVIFFYAGLEGISILENASCMGVPVPDKLRDSLIQLKEGNKKCNENSRRINNDIVDINNSIEDINNENIYTSGDDIKDVMSDIEDVKQEVNNIK